MPKFNWVFSTVLVTAMVSGLLTQSARRTEAQTNRSESWKNIFQIFSVENEPPLPPRGGGTRGPMCAISPRSMSANGAILSDRPLFVWRGEAGEIELRSLGSNKALWRQSVTADTRRIKYEGEALQPGQKYNWIINRNNHPLSVVLFQVMDAEKRDRINRRLESLEGELKAKGASAEEIAMYRARYFTQQRLWSDVLQEVYSVENPSTELVELLETIPKEVCPRPQTQMRAKGN